MSSEKHSWPPAVWRPRIPMFVVTHRPEEQPTGDDFVFVGGIAAAIDQAKAAAGGKHLHVIGGSQIIRQTLAAGMIDELMIVIAPAELGG